MTSVMKRYSGAQHYHSYSQQDPTHRNLNNNLTHHNTQKTSSSMANGDLYHSSTHAEWDNINQHRHHPVYSSSDEEREDHSYLYSGRDYRGRKDQRDFIPSFVLADACKTNDERKVREICRRLSLHPDEDVQPVVNFQDQAGRTPLSYACGGGSIPVIEELSRFKIIDCGLADNDGNSPLHYASQAGQSEAVDLLIARFADELDLNCRNSAGLTPLMKAALQGRTRCVKSLLSAGASSTLRDYSRGLTAAEWATLCGRHICAEVISRCAKDINRHPSSCSMNFPSTSNRDLPISRSNMELKRASSDESPYYIHMNTRNTGSGASWLKNKIIKALGAGGASTPTPAVASLSDKRPSISEGSYRLMGGATICAGSLLLPSIKPLIEQQKTKLSTAPKKFTIPTLHVTPVRR